MWNTQAASQICQQKEIYERHKQHLKSLQAVQSQVNYCEQPYNPNFLKSRPQQQLQKEETLDQISFQNQILLSRMLQIERNEGPLNPQKIVGEYRSNHIHPDSILRQDYLKRITTDNQSILKRLQNAQTFYDSKDIIHYTNNYSHISKNISQNARRSFHNDYRDSKSSRSLNRTTGSFSINPSSYNPNYSHNNSIQQQLDILNQEKNENPYQVRPQTASYKTANRSAVRPMSADRNFKNNYSNVDHQINDEWK